MSSSFSAVPRPAPPSYAYIFLYAELTQANLVRHYYLRSDGKIQVSMLTRTEEKAMLEQTFDPLKLVRDATSEELNLFHYKVVSDATKVQSIARIIYG